MNAEQFMDLLQWSTLINLILLVFYGVMIMAARGFVYRMHSKMFPISEGQFDAIHYAGILFFKLLWLVFNLVPLLACYIVL